MRGVFRKKVDEVTLWLEGQKEEYLARAAALEHRFYAAFYEQCIESTVADGYEMFLLDFSTYNYFRAHRADFEVGGHPSYHSGGAPEKKRTELGRDEAGDVDGVCTERGRTKDGGDLVSMRLCVSK